MESVNLSQPHLDNHCLGAGFSTDMTKMTNLFHCPKKNKDQTQTSGVKVWHSTKSAKARHARCEVERNSRALPRISSLHGHRSLLGCILAERRNLAAKGSVVKDGFTAKTNNLDRIALIPCHMITLYCVCVCSIASPAWSSKVRCKPGIYKAATIQLALSRSLVSWQMSFVNLGSSYSKFNPTFSLPSGAGCLKPIASLYPEVCCVWPVQGFNQAEDQLGESSPESKTKPW